MQKNRLIPFLKQAYLKSLEIKAEIFCLAFFKKFSYNKRRKADDIPLVWLTRKIRKTVSDNGPNGWRATEKPESDARLWA